MSISLITVARLSLYILPSKIINVRAFSLGFQNFITVLNKRIYEKEIEGCGKNMYFMVYHVVHKTNILYILLQYEI